MSPPRTAAVIGLGLIGGSIARELVALIARRTELARRTGEAKRAAGKPTLDPAREAVVIRRAAANRLCQDRLAVAQSLGRSVVTSMISHLF